MKEKKKKKRKRLAPVMTLRPQGCWAGQQEVGPAPTRPLLPTQEAQDPAPFCRGASGP